MEDISEDYKSSLADLNCNSKPLINMLTMLAEDNAKYAPQIVQVIVEHILTVPPECKLPGLYLIDSIIKNVGQQYLSLFSGHIVILFASVFEKVDEKTRLLLFKLRQTWSDIFPNKILYAIDVKVKQVDPAWPITAQQPQALSIHVNPKFLGTAAAQKPTDSSSSLKEEEARLKVQQNAVLKELLAKQERLRLLEQKKALEIAKRKLIKTENSDSAQVQPIQQRSVDPRAIAKLNPRLSQRDPRLQKIAPNLLNKPIVEKTIKTSQQQVISSPTVISVSAANVSVSSIVTVPKSENKLEKVIDQKEKTKSILEKEKNDKKSPKKNENIFLVKKPLDKNKFEKTQERNDVNISNLSHCKSADDKRKRKLDDDWKSYERRKVESQSNVQETSPKKSFKSNKKENSLKDKKGAKEIEKSPPRSIKNDVTAKKQKQTEEFQARSPLSKLNKKNEKLKMFEDSESQKERKHDKNSTRHKDTISSSNNTSLSHDNDMDTDLRLLNRSSCGADQSSKSLKRSPIDENETDISEPPEKKLRDEKSDSSTDTLFGSEDQDYRQLTQNQKAAQHKGWAQYKASHPDEFKSPLRPAREKMDGTPEEEEEQFQDRNSNRPFRKEDTFDEAAPAQFDKLGRPRFGKARYNQRMDWRRGPFRREQYFRGGRYHPFSEPRLSEVLLSSVMSNPKDMLHKIEEMYRLGRMSEGDYHDVRRDLERMWESEEYRRLKDSEPWKQPWNRDSPPIGYLEHPPPGNMPESKFRNFSLPPVESFKPEIQGPMLPPPLVKSFKLDSKFCTVHFVGDRAMFVTENNVPKELTFKGHPTKVFIEGLKPITLRFDGKPVRFELNGKMYSMRFGTPARELYINGHPYEGKFGGPPFAAMLEPGRVYRIRLDGPPPQVVISDEPAHDLYREFLLRNKGKPGLRFGNMPPQHHGTQPPPISAPLPYDVDMRNNIASVENNKNVNYMPSSSSAGSEDMKDIDWRHLPDKKVTNDRPNYADSQQNQAHGTFENWNERKPPVSADNSYSNIKQEPKDWQDCENASFRPSPPEMLDRASTMHTEWRELRPPFQNHKIEENSQNPPPPLPQGPHQDSSQHRSDWTPLATESQNFEPMRTGQQEHNNIHWKENNFSQDNWRPPNHPPVPEQAPMFNMQRNNSQNPQYFDPSLGQPTRMPIRPGYIAPPQRPLFNDAPLRQRPPGPPPNFVRNPQEMPPMHCMPPPPPPILMPPPRPPIHMRIPMGPPPPAPVMPPVSVSAPVTMQVDAPAQFSTTASVTQAPSQLNVQTQPPPSIAVTSTVVSTTPITTPAPVPAPSTDGSSIASIDIGTLVQKLLAAGIISKPVIEEPVPDVSSSEVSGEKDDEEDSVAMNSDLNEETVPRIELKLDSLKMRYGGVCSALYRGSQCASCGMRFKEIHSERYSRHLDWHFRVNRREKDGAKKAFSRKWYYEVENSLQYHFEEFEDLEERAPSFFDLQADEKQYQTTEPAEVPSVKSSGDDTEVCAVCQESFQLIWVEEEEEWHLRDAVRHEDQVYHPACYEDFKKASEEPVEEPETVTEEKNPEISSEIDTTTAEKITSENVDESAADEKIEVKEESEEKVTTQSENENESEVVDSANEVIKQDPEEEEEEKLEGKPGEEEIIGMITESDVEVESEPRAESKMVVMQSGGIVMKVRAESIQPASPAPENTQEPAASTKDASEESEEEEFRPPTPDPRFKVMAPVQRGTELSGLCCIM